MSDLDPGRVAARLLLPAALVLAAIAAVALDTGIAVPMMTRDLAALAHLSPLAGVLSNLGILLWAATAAVTLFVALAEAPRLAPAVRRFFLCAGVLSLYLTLDDCFQIHEDLAPRYLHLRERYVYLALALATAAHLWASRAVILRSNWSLLVLAFGFLGASALLDTFLLAWAQGIDKDWEFFFEDGAKWLGIVCWSAYHVLAGARRGTIDAAVRAALPERPGLGVPAQRASDRRAHRARGFD